MANILIVDDIESNLFLLNLILKSNNHKIFEAQNKADAVKLAESEEIDLAILDVHMPDATGYDLALEIRNIEDKNKLPVFFLTADVNESDTILKCKSLENSKILIKPIVKNDLLNQIKEIGLN
jgi:two-component system, sensor histidine kinase and response regulator